MSILINDLKDMITEFLEIIDEEGITSTLKLEAVVNQRYVGRLGELEISMRPSDRLTEEITASYIYHGQGIPIEVRVNKYLGYSMIILRTEKKILGYTTIYEYPDSNDLVQEKRLEVTDLNIIKKELQYIIS